MNGLGGGSLVASAGAAEKWGEGLAAGRTVGFRCLDNPEVWGRSSWVGGVPVKTCGGCRRSRLGAGEGSSLRCRQRPEQSARGGGSSGPGRMAVGASGQQRASEGETSWGASVDRREGESRGGPVPVPGGKAPPRGVRSQRTERPPSHVC